MADMWVRIASRPLAEEACRKVFGEEPRCGPQVRTPASLLRLLVDWPKPTDAAHKVALHLPIDFDISHDMRRAEEKAIVLVVNRMTVYCDREFIGYTLRTDQLGLNALATYWETVEAHRRKIRQAH